MRRTVAGLVGACLLAAGCAGASDPTTADPTTTPTASATAATEVGGWELVWEDTFDGDAGTPPDDRWWNHEIGGDGWGNHELQYYTDDTGSVAHDGDGHLVITAAEGGPTDGTGCWYGDCRYTSARITTRGKVEAEYGRIEVRARLPEGDGMWPAFWMLGTNIDLKGWPNAGEIDVMEHIGREPETVHGTVHGPTYSGADGIGGSYRFPEGTPADDFHTYAIEWEPDRIAWYMDDVHYATLLPTILPKAERWVFDHPFFLILNLAVGGQWPGEPTDETTFPQTFVIDHVRVYRERTATDG
jgi:beta-glucanase (GH16 family)